MPWASCAGLVAPPVGDCEPKISIMPTTVPNRPSSGAAVAMVPSVVRNRSRLCAVERPASSIASFITWRGLFSLRRPAASTSPSGESLASLSRMSGVTPWRA